eukprot:SAG22_NODE_4581_length_1226_cov_1.081633_1_plen_97_part_00
MQAAGNERGPRGDVPTGTGEKSMAETKMLIVSEALQRALLAAVSTAADHSSSTLLDDREYGVPQLYSNDSQTSDAKILDIEDSVFFWPRSINFVYR